MLPPASMKRMQACQKAKAALEAKVESGELTVQGYVDSLGLLMKRDQKLVQAHKTPDFSSESQAAFGAVLAPFVQVFSWARAAFDAGAEGDEARERAEAGGGAVCPDQAGEGRGRGRHVSGCWGVAAGRCVTAM